MKQYWPMAIAVTEDGPQQLFTYDSVLTMKEAEKQCDFWTHAYGYKLAARWVDITENNAKRKTALQVDIDYVKELWENFGDVPMNPETECVEEAWGDSLTFAREFPTGTHREEIWHWFEETFHVSVAKDLM